MAPTDWLMQPVPLYAFLLAGATSPLLWSRYARELTEQKLGLGDASSSAPIPDDPPGGEDSA